METNDTGEKSIEEIYEEVEEEILEYFRALARFVGVTIEKEDEPEVALGVSDAVDSSCCINSDDGDTIVILDGDLFDMTARLEEAGHALRGVICRKVLNEKTNPYESRCQEVQAGTVADLSQIIEEFHSEKGVEGRKARYMDSAQRGVAAELTGRLSVFIGLKYLQETENPFLLYLKDGEWTMAAEEHREAFQKRISIYKEFKVLWGLVCRIDGITEKWEGFPWRLGGLEMLKAEIEKICMGLSQFEIPIAKTQAFTFMIREMEALVKKLPRRGKKKKEKGDEIIKQLKRALPLYRSRITRFLDITTKAGRCDWEKDLGFIWHHLGYMAAEALAQKGDIEEIKAVFAMPTDEIIERYIKTDPHYEEYSEYIDAISGLAAMAQNPIPSLSNET